MVAFGVVYFSLLATGKWVAAHVLSGMPARATDLIAGAAHELKRDLELAPYQMVWLDCVAPA